MLAIVYAMQTNSTNQFIEKLNQYLEEFKSNPSTRHLITSKLEAHLYSGFTYDAVWAIAYALHNTEHELLQQKSTLTLESFDYFETNNLSNIFSRQLARTNFSGVSVSLPIIVNGALVLMDIYPFVCTRRVQYSLMRMEREQVLLGFTNSVSFLAFQPLVQ